jgi:hypothetical protein
MNNETQVAVQEVGQQVEEQAELRELDLQEVCAVFGGSNMPRKTY